MTDFGTYTTICTWGTLAKSLQRNVRSDRQQADEFAAQSHRKAAAWAEGWFDWETFPISIPQRRGDPLS